MKNQMDIKSIDKAIVLSILFVLLFIGAMFGLTFAFFSLIITGNEEASSMSVDLIDLGTVTFLDGDEIDASGIYPMASNERLSKTFTISSSQNEADIDYVIYLTVNENSFVQTYSNEFTYTLNCTSNSSGSAPNGISAEIPASRVAPYQIGSGYLKTNGDTHTCIFTIGVNEVGSNQDYNQGKRFNGRLSVETKKYTHDGSIWE